MGNNHSAYRNRRKKLFRVSSLMSAAVIVAITAQMCTASPEYMYSICQVDAVVTGHHQVTGEPLYACYKHSWQYGYDAAICQVTLVGYVHPYIGQGGTSPEGCLLLSSFPAGVGFDKYLCWGSPPNGWNNGHIGGCNDTAMYGTCSSQYQQVTAFNAAHPDMTAWWYFTTTSGGTEYKCMAYYVDTEGDAWEVTAGAYDTVNPLNNPNCMTKTAFDARNNTDCEHAPDANDTCVSAQHGSPVATTEADECGAAAGDERGQTVCGN